MMSISTVAIEGGSSVIVEPEVGRTCAGAGASSTCYTHDLGLTKVILGEFYASIGKRTMLETGWLSTTFGRRAQPINNVELSIFSMLMGDTFNCLKSQSMG
jgi:hypothetical protein